MIPPVDNTIRAINAFQKKMNVSANNIANVQTDGFKKNRVTISEHQSGGVYATIDQVQTPGIQKETIQDGKVVKIESSNVDLAEEIPEMITTTHEYKANLKSLKTQDDILGSLLDILT